VATYIPELGKANPDHFGICLATVDGQSFCAGDCDEEFTIQSICKPLLFKWR
jgi:glutaminase